MRNIYRGVETIEILKPDLMVNEVVIPLIDSASQPISINWQVANIGLGDLENRHLTDEILVSYSPDYNENSVIELDTINYLTSLSPNNSIQRQYSKQLPDSIPGPYYIFIHTDCYDTIYENQSEENNIARSSSTIQILRPDLIVSEIVAPPVIYSDEDLSIEWITKNVGPISILNSSWTDRILLSSDLVFDPDSVPILGNRSLSVSLLTGDSTLNQKIVHIPEGLDGSYYIHAYTDINNDISENIFENNNITSLPVQLEIDSWADLQVININLEDSSVAGSSIPLHYFVKNIGTKIIKQKTWYDRVYLSEIPVWYPDSAIFLREFVQTDTLNLDETYNTYSTVNLPPELSNGYYFLFIYTDEYDSIFENTGENNNIIQSNPIYISKLPPVDLAVSNVNNPISANSGQSINIQWDVQNIGVSATKYSWYDGVYLSTDSIWDKNSDINFGYKQHSGKLDPGEGYSSSTNFSLPNGISGDYYLLAVADNYQVHNDENPFNNYKAKTDAGNTMQTTHITLTPPPDLVVTSLTAPSQITTGEPFTVSWSVTNQGTGITIPDFWKDKLYLSTDFVINTGDLLIETLDSLGPLNVNASYNQDMEITIPNSFSGNYIFILKTNAENKVYESNSNNNTSNTFIVISQPPPADLVVTAIDPPDSVIVGELATINWTVKNIGNNKAAGTVRDHVYFSKDTIWDINDTYFGIDQTIVNLETGEVYNTSTYNYVKDIETGLYYVIVRTDVLNKVYENNENNNSGFSTDTIISEVTQLPLDIVTSSTLYNNRNLYFSVEIADSLNDETMLTTLKGDSITGSNEMYLRHNAIASRINYDYSHSNPFFGNQEIYVPSLNQGNYYMLLYGRTELGNSQDITVLPEILNFELRSVDATSAGNIGPVTILMRGSKFEEDMQFQLINDTTIYSTEIFFQDRTSAYTTFNLEGLTEGLYDVVADKYCNDRDTLFQAFEIKEGLKPELGLNVISPPNVRTNRVTSFTVEFANLGNVDLIEPTILVKSEGGAPIALNVDDLNQNFQELTLQLSEENGPPGRLRPGYIGTVVIYTKSTGPLGFTIVKLN